MKERSELRQWTTGCILLAVLAGGCVGGGARLSNGTGGAKSGSGGAEATAGTAGEASGGESGGAGSGGTTAGGGGGTHVSTFVAGVATIEPPPLPPSSDVPQPSATVTTPNLRVLPWAGFTAAISYTFDDTQPSQLEHWEELKATGVQMTFFANPSSNSRSGYDASWTAVAAAGNEIGNHTWSHCYSALTGCTPVGTAEDELDQTSAYIMSHFGVTAVHSFASPYGDAGWTKYASPRFLVGRGVGSGFVPASGQANWYNLPVIAVAAGQTATNFNASIDSARSQGRWGIFMYHSILPTAYNWYAGVPIADITASITYAKSLGDVWVDTMGEIGAYARAQQVFEAVTPSENTWTWTLPDHFPKGGVLRVTVDGGSLSQGGSPLSWNAHGYYEVALDSGTLTWSP